MAISGAAVIPPLMAFVADHTGALHWSMFLLVGCYLVVLAFAKFAPRLGRASA